MSLPYVILYLYTYVFEQCAFVEADELPRNEKGPSLFQNMLKHTRFSPSKLMTIYSGVEAQNPNQSYGSCKMYLNVVRSFIHQRETQPVSSWTSAPSPRIYQKFFWNSFTNKIPHISPFPCLFVFFIQYWSSINKKVGHLQNNGGKSQADGQGSS